MGITLFNKSWYLLSEVVWSEQSCSQGEKGYDVTWPYTCGPECTCTFTCTHVCLYFWWVQKHHFDFLVRDLWKLCYGNLQRGYLTQWLVWVASPIYKNFGGFDFKKLLFCGCIDDMYPVGRRDFLINSLVLQRRSPVTGLMSALYSCCSVHWLFKDQLNLVANSHK